MFDSPEKFFGLLGGVCLVLGVVFILRPDQAGVEVRSDGNQAWHCNKVVPFSEDHTMAICGTKEECTRICLSLPKEDK